MDNYFPEFEKSLRTQRVLKAYNYADYLRNAPAEIMRGQPASLPDIVYQEGDVTYFSTSSYARGPGEDTGTEIEALLGNRLPSDFRAFYDKFAEALVVTRSYPIHIWNLNKISEWFWDMRYKKPYPLRFIRFGDYWDLRATQFALWQKDPAKLEWCVVATSVEQIDDQYDDPSFTDYNKLGDSFSAWLEDWVARDGLPDPFMKLGTEGGFLDPA